MAALAALFLTLTLAAVAALPLSSVSAGLPAINMTLVLFANATDRLAICNDGTPSGYYIHLAPGSTRWLIYLQGGGLVLCFMRACVFCLRVRC